MFVLQKQKCLYVNLQSSHISWH